MWNVDELFILSDFHLAAERGVGFFQADAELSACLRWILEKSRNSVTVLAGDIFNFLFTGDGNTRFDSSSLNDSTRSIIDHHPEVFDALAELARSPRHGLAIMGGDHDPELIYPVVQEAIERRLGVDAFRSPLRWLVQGEALCVRVGEAVVMVEHGDALDPWNRTNHDHWRGAFALASRNILGPERTIDPTDGLSDGRQPIGAFLHKLLDGSQYRLPLPMGSKLMLAVVNELRQSYHWVDCLKPGTEADLPLLWHVASSRQRMQILNLLDEYFDLKDRAHTGKVGNSRNPKWLYEGERETYPSPTDQALQQWGVGAREQQMQRLNSLDEYFD